MISGRCMLQTVSLHPLLWLSSIPMYTCIHVQRLLCPFARGSSASLWFPGCCEQCGDDHGQDGSAIEGFHFPWNTEPCALAGVWGGVICSVFREPLCGFHLDCTTTSEKMCPSRHNRAFSTSLSGVVLCVFPPTGDVEYVFMSLSAACRFFLWETLPRIYCPFEMNLFRIEFSLFTLLFPLPLKAVWRNLFCISLLLFNVRLGRALQFLNY